MVPDRRACTDHRPRLDHCGRVRLGRRVETQSARLSVAHVRRAGRHRVRRVPGDATEPTPPGHAVDTELDRSGQSMIRDVVPGPSNQRASARAGFHHRDEHHALGLAAFLVTPRARYTRSGQPGPAHRDPTRSTVPRRIFERWTRRLDRGLRSKAPTQLDRHPLRWSALPALVGTAVMFSVGQLLRCPIAGEPPPTQGRCGRTCSCVWMTAVMVLCLESLRALGASARGTHLRRGMFGSSHSRSVCSARRRSRASSRSTSC